MGGERRKEKRKQEERRKKEKFSKNWSRGDGGRGLLFFREYHTSPTLRHIKSNKKT